LKTLKFLSLQLQYFIHLHFQITNLDLSKLLTSMPPKQKQAGVKSGSTNAKTPENDGIKIGDDEINTEVWELHKDFYFFFTPLSGKVETKDLKNGGTMKLFTIDGISSDNSRVLVEV
jgi:hypothetical protein